MSIMNLVKEIQPNINDKTMKYRFTKFTNLLIQINGQEVDEHLLNTKFFVYSKELTTLESNLSYNPATRKLFGDRRDFMCCSRKAYHQLSYHIIILLSRDFISLKPVLFAIPTGHERPFYVVNRFGYLVHLSRVFKSFGRIIFSLCFISDSNWSGVINASTIFYRTLEIILCKLLTSMSNSNIVFSNINIELRTLIFLFSLAIAIIIAFTLTHISDHEQYAYHLSDCFLIY
ncbi:hypothetical protein AGLY_002435 [Aphis glycines]|uniref:Uncharacterized protein n=1 Tax=Aphis glycines TaxID=307491 RepID=A0A6G0U3E9_APHGL|nr:hypothetical protein AGLY_002435 [Aphis glycines]